MNVGLLVILVSSAAILSERAFTGCEDTEAAAERDAD